MNYLVAADGKDWDAKISKRFIHAKMYLIANTAAEEIKAYESSVYHDPFELAELHEKSGTLAGIITCNIGPHAFELASQRGLPVYLLRNATVRRALELVQEGKVDAAESSSLRRSIQERRHRQQPLSEYMESEPSGRFHQGKGQGLGKGQGQGQGRGRFKRFR
ncbi:hypothetical protein KKH18_13285 [bacterium]|nr:hypothetical protein [bacterium]